MLWTVKAEKYLKKFWNIEKLKDKQFDVINELLLGNDVIGLLPTGYGKSMCYLMPPLVTKKIIFIISPLISLMDDQKDKLNKMEIPCSALHGNNKNKEEEVFKIIDGKIKIVYMSPEYLIKSDGLELARTLISTNKLGFLAVDESHCTSVWGQDFRPEYTKIKTFREEFPQIPILAVTATATNTVCNDISKMLLLNKPTIITASFDRPNLYIKIQEMPNIVIKKKSKMMPKEDIAITYINKYPNEKIIIYTNSRKDTEELSTNLNKINKNCSEAYHAGLSKKLREDIQTKFMEGEIKVIISTIAFGMGIDQIVRCVIVFGAPSSIEEYYQQIGRGGRDGKDCETVLFFDYSKLVIAKYMIRDLKIKFPTLYNVKMENLTRISKLVYLNTCRRKFILEYFNEECKFFNCNNCDNCCEQELIDVTDKIFPLIMNRNVLSGVNEFRNNFLTQIKELDKKNNERVIDFELLDPMTKWKNFVSNKYNLQNLPENLKIRIPKKFIKEQTVEDKFDKYEKLLQSY
jgi:ATP-dependent DNA helicase RecQ